MNACPAVYVVVSQLLPTDVYTVSEPCWTTTTATPGCECQPEEPPGLTVICATATSDPAFSGMVPSVVLVPRANGMFVSPEGGVAPLGATVIAVTTPASPTLISAHLTDRFITSPFRTCRSGLVVLSEPGTRSSSLVPPNCSHLLRTRLKDELNSCRCRRHLQPGDKQHPNVPSVSRAIHLPHEGSLAGRQDVSEAVLLPSPRA